jgi:hypothetical protein
MGGETKWLSIVSSLSTVMVMLCKSSSNVQDSQQNQRLSAPQKHISKTRTVSESTQKDWCGKDRAPGVSGGRESSHARASAWKAAHELTQPR